jgi:Flp pilus assembly protein TadD
MYKIGSLMLALLLVAACSGGGGGGASTGSPALMSPSGMSNQAAADKNNEGVDHLSQGHYAVSTPLFQEAVSMNPNFAEAHFNLAISLDGEGKHAEAAEAFKKANELGTGNPKITENATLKQHLK